MGNHAPNHGTPADVTQSRAHERITVRASSQVDESRTKSRQSRTPVITLAPLSRRGGECREGPIDPAPRGSSSRARARHAPPVERDHPVTGRAGHVPNDERDRLASSLGALVRAHRLAGGWSLTRLARAVGCSRSTIRRVQAGQLRPRESLLRCIASVLAVDNPRPFAQQLIEAAGPSLREDSEGTYRQRHRRANTAMLAGHRPLPTDLAHRLALHRQASALWSRAMQLLNQPGAFDDVPTLDEVLRLQDQAKRLRDQAGPPITIYVGRRVISAGWV